MDPVTTTQTVAEDPFAISLDKASTSFTSSTLLLAGVIIVVLLIISLIKWVAKIKDRFSVSVQTAGGNKLVVKGAGTPGEKKPSRRPATEDETQNVDPQNQAASNYVRPTQSSGSATVGTPPGKIPLLQHNYFINLQEMIHSNCLFVSRSECDDEEKTVKMILMKAFLRECKLPVFHDRMVEFINELIASNGACLPIMNSLIWNGVIEYEQKARTLKVNLPDKRVIYGIPETLVAKFNEWHSPKVDMCARKIREVLSGQFYQSWQMKVIIILEILDLAFEMTKYDANMTLASLNGEIEEEIKLKLGL